MKIGLVSAAALAVLALSTSAFAEATTAANFVSELLKSVENL